MECFWKKIEEGAFHIFKNTREKRLWLLFYVYKNICIQTTCYNMKLDKNYALIKGFLLIKIRGQINL